MLVSIIDRMMFGDRQITSDGYLATVGKISRSGTQEYLGRELGRPDLDRVTVYRDADEVFNEDAIRSFAYKPVTDDHPPVGVTSKNWRTYSRGQLGGKALRDGDHLEFPMVIMDQDLIDKIQSGKSDLSAGYTAEIIFEDNVAPDGTPYQARMTSIRGNHCAVVDKGRAITARLGDAWPVEDKIPPKKEVTVKTLIVDGIPVKLDDEAAVEAVFKKLTDAKEVSDKAAAEAAKALTDTQAATATTATEHATAIQAKDAEIATVKAENETLKTQLADASSPEKLKAAAADYAKVVDTAKALGVTAADGASAADIKKATVTAKLGDAAKDWTDAQFDVSFNTLAAGVKADAKDSFQQTFANPTEVKNFADERAKAVDARKEMIDAMLNGNKAEAK